MSEVKKFEDLKVWQAARHLSKEIWSLINTGPFSRNFTLRDQIDRSSGSIMDNISEGYGREGRKEFRQFLSVSKGSCSEVKSQLYRAYDREFLSKEKFEELYDLTDQIGKMINGLMAYLKSSEISGSKFKEPDTDYLLKTED